MKNLKKNVKPPASQPNESTNQVFLFSAPIFGSNFGDLWLGFSNFIFQMFYACKLLGKIKPPQQPICVGWGNSKKIFLRKTWKYSWWFFVGIFRLFREFTRFVGRFKRRFGVFFVEQNIFDKIRSPLRALFSMPILASTRNCKHTTSKAWNIYATTKRNCSFPLNPGCLTRILI